MGAPGEMTMARATIAARFLLDIADAGGSGHVLELVTPTSGNVLRDVVATTIDYRQASAGELGNSGSALALAVAFDVERNDAAFWQTFVALAACVRPGGYLAVHSRVVNAKGSAAHAHGFYAETGQDLAQWANESGSPCACLESFIATDASEPGEYFALFQRLPTSAPTPSEKLEQRLEGVRENGAARVHASVPARPLSLPASQGTTPPDSSAGIVDEPVPAASSVSSAIGIKTDAGDSDLTVQLQREVAARTAADRAVSELRGQLASRFQEIAIMTKLLKERESIVADRQWLTDVFRRLASAPRSWALLSDEARRAREHRLLQRAGLFDAAAYLSRYPDVAEARMDPLRHYIWHGIAENRARPISSS